MKRQIQFAGALLVAFCIVASGSAMARPKPGAKKSDSPKTEAEQTAVEKTEKPAEKPAEKAAEAKPAEATAASATKDSHYKVTKKPLKIDVSLDGYFAARQTHEIELKLKAWTTLEVVKAVPHGAQVKRGESLVTFDMEKLDDAIAAAGNEKKSSDAALSLAEADMKLLDAGIPLEVASTERSHKRSGEDFARYYAVDLPLTRKAVDLNLEMAEEYLENQQEELRQLEKMYAADDLTEETEEIILKRQRSAVQRAEYMVERAKAEHQESLNVLLPRRDEDLKDNAQLEQLRYQRMKTSIPLMLDRAKAELEKAKIAKAKADEKLDDLLADRDAMSVKAPADGIVYYGESTCGKFATTLTNPLQKGDTIPANQVFMTILQPRPMEICVDVPEDKLHAVRPGMKATAEPKAWPDLRVPAKVTEVDAIPLGEGKFRARLSAAPGKNDAALVPGMACSVKLVPYLKADALVVPKAAVETDPLDDARSYVYLVQKAGEPKKQPVTLGKKTEKVIEILSGLSEGDEILSEPPKKD